LLGEQIAELKGKVTGQRVLNSEGPSIETAISFDGTYKGTSSKMYVTFVGRPTSTGVIHGEGHGVVMAGESDVATFTADGFGRCEFYLSSIRRQRLQIKRCLLSRLEIAR
jgi:hypothetical protein